MYSVSTIVNVYYSMSNLKNLETLNISRNKFGRGLPDVLTSMTSLRELYFGDCELLPLPKRFVKAILYICSAIKTVGTLQKHRKLL